MVVFFMTKSFFFVFWPNTYSKTNNTIYYNNKLATTTTTPGVDGGEAKRRWKRGRGRQRGVGWSVFDPIRSDYE
jgi:hypothetical protein